MSGTHVGPNRDGLTRAPTHTDRQLLTRYAISSASRTKNRALKSTLLFTEVCMTHNALQAW